MLYKADSLISEMVRNQRMCPMQMNSSEDIFAENRARTYLESPSRVLSRYKYFYQYEDLVNYKPCTANYQRLLKSKLLSDIRASIAEEARKINYKSSFFVMDMPGGSSEDRVLFYLNAMLLFTVLPDGYNHISVNKEFGSDLMALLSSKSIHISTAAIQVLKNLTDFVPSWNQALLELGIAELALEKFRQSQNTTYRKTILALLSTLSYDLMTDSLTNQIFTLFARILVDESLYSDESIRGLHFLSLYCPDFFRSTQSHDIFLVHMNNCSHISRLYAYKGAFSLVANNDCEAIDYYLSNNVFSTICNTIKSDIPQIYTAAIRLGVELLKHSTSQISESGFLDFLSEIDLTSYTYRVSIDIGNILVDLSAHCPEEILYIFHDSRCLEDIIDMLEGLNPSAGSSLVICIHRLITTYGESELERFGNLIGHFSDSEDPALSNLINEVSSLISV